MSRHRWYSRALLTVALIGFGLAVPAGAAEAASGLSLPPARTPSRLVTLITGDRVSLSDNGQAAVQYDPDRSGISFSTFHQHDDVYVIPSDAAPLVWGGQLDLQLFDVSQLLAYGSDADAGPPLILSYSGATASAARTAVARGGGRVARELHSVHGLAVRPARHDRGSLWRQLTQQTPRHLLQLRKGLAKVWLDAKFKPTDEQSTPQVGAPTAWAAGFDGTGETVAVVDTGIDDTHPDLAGKVVAAQDFTGSSDTRDLVGHGTHVASIIAGTGAASGGVQKGVAPGAQLLNSKVCDATGCSESAIIAGMQWAVAQGAKIVNMSLGGPDTPGVDPLEQAVNDLTASSGALFVVAAGNAGPADTTLESPGSADAALTVGAVDKADDIGSFSSRGPRIDDAAIKPDITAPGVDIVGARSSTSTLGNPGDSYVSLTGTSMATPHVAGAAAIALQSHPGWTPAQLKAALMGSADPNPSVDPFVQGAGRLNIGRGYAQTVLASPPSVSLGRQAAPHGDDPTLTKTVTYHNYGSAAVTLTLSTTTHDPNGSAAPAGMFSLSDSSLTVPAGGDASVTLTAQTNLATVDGTYSGTITASGTGVSVQTPFAEDAAPQAFTVSLSGIDRNGGTPLVFITEFGAADGTAVYGVASPTGSTSIDLPANTYLVWTDIYTLTPEGQVVLTILTKQRLDLTGPQSLIQDARNGGEIHVTVPDPAAQASVIEVSGQLTNVIPNRWTGVSEINTSGTLYAGQIDGPNSFVFGFTSRIGVRLADPGPGGDIRNSPHVYSTAHFTDGQLPAGLTRDIGESTLATVTAEHGAQLAGAVGYKGAESEPNQSVMFTALTQLDPMDLPMQRTESYDTTEGVRWWNSWQEFDSANNELSYLLGSITTYTAGASTNESWNHPVYGPAFTTTVTDSQWVVRTGDKIYTNLPLFGDGSGHAGQALPEETGTFTLKRNGVVIGEQPYPSGPNTPFVVPPDWATYEFDATVQRAAPIALSTSISAAWTFTSSTVDPNSVLRLQLWAATFTPALDANNTAPAGTSFTIPMIVAPQPGSAAAGVHTVTVDYSTDDGATWQPATVTNTDGAYSATLTHPNITGFVSLRAHVDDFAGNAVDETIIHAYKIAP